MPKVNPCRAILAKREHGYREPAMLVRVELPHGWRHFSAAEKIEHLIGLDRCSETLSWPLDELDPVRR
jgi:hypothetical protein